MRIKKIIKRGVKDLTFINNFLNEKLQGKDEVVINVNENVYNKILCRYGRKLEYNIDRFSTGFTLFFNNDVYSFEVIRECYGKYGTYYKLHIVDIDKLSHSRIDKRLNGLESNIEGELKDLYVQLFTVQEFNNMNPFSLNLPTEKITKGFDERENDILKKIEKYF